MIYYTGDIHGSITRIKKLCETYKLTSEDTIVILGDVGANYYGNKKDRYLKKAFSKLAPTIFCIHGNHEIRPEAIPSYQKRKWHGGVVWYEPDYPNILFAIDGEIFDIEGIKHLVIGGAYSVDKFYRIVHNYGWWPDEQPSEEIKQYVEKQIAEKDFDVILSHTCPYKYRPIEAFISGIDQNEIDISTEKWLDTIEEKTDYMAWFCGHWHIDKRIDKIHFLFHGIEINEPLLKEAKKGVDSNG